MKLAIMQPYLFPYIGYFQLIEAVDRFVFLDNVNFIKRGWVNRNRLLFSGTPHYFTVPLVSASQNVRICDISVSADAGWKKKLEKSIRLSYAKAPYFDPIYTMLTKVLFDGETLIGEMAKRSIVAVTDYLELPVEFVWSSAVYDNHLLKGEALIRDICRREQATVYYNLPGGRALYDAAKFAGDGIELSFIEPILPAYEQFSSVFEPGLSIIDVLMHNEPAAVKRMLK
jgi:hypothetical protein